MNFAAAMIASGIGGLFFAATSVFYFQPSFITPEKVLDTVLTTQHSKARTAVTRLLLNPSSAEFEGLRSVQVDAAKYVCGAVKAKDRLGVYAGHRAFVYTVAIDFARIDDDGVIAQRHDAYRACPVSVEEEKIAQNKLTISPGALAVAKTIQKTLPSADTSVLSSLTAQAGGTGGAGAGGTMTQQLNQLAGQPGAGSAGQQVNAAFKPAWAKTPAGDDAEWHPDRPPAFWPSFPPEHPLSKPGPKRSDAEALALAKAIEARWEQFRSGASKRPPSREEILEAERALLAVNAKAPDYRQAWAAFIRLRMLEREAAA